MEHEMRDATAAPADELMVETTTTPVSSISDLKDVCVNGYIGSLTPRIGEWTRRRRPTRILAATL